MKRHTRFAIGNNRPILMVVILAISAGIACAPQGSQPSLELAALSDRWADALAAGDIDTLVAMYTPDCRIMPPNAPMKQGHDAVRASFGGMIEAGLTAEIETIEATVSGDMGHKIGTYTLKSPGGATVAQGKFVETWRKTAAGWQLSTDIFNSDLPVAGSGTTVVITHEVEDADHWLAAWSGPDSRHEMFADNGVVSTRVFQNPEKPTELGLLVEVVDMEQFMSWVASPESQTAKTEDGVIDESLRFHTEVK